VSWKEENLSRAAIVDGVFKRLSARTDGGLGQFRATLQQLLNWSHFDPYYFDNLRKLDREKAERALQHLRQLQEIRDARLKEERRRREEHAKAAQVPKTTLGELKEHYLQLFNAETNPQKRGYELERVLQELAKLSGLEVTEPFRVVGEQIDGAVKYDGEHYVCEAKWHDRLSSNEPLYQFAGKVEGKMYGRGIFASVNGFSSDAVVALTRGKALRTVLVDGEDLMLVLEGALTFAQMLDTKVRAAQTAGHIFVHPLTGAPKVRG
jgi:hypothetical protein